MESTAPASKILEGLVTEQQVADELDCCRRTVKNLEARLGVRVFKAGHLRLIDINELRARLRGQTGTSSRRRGRPPKTG